MLIVNTENCMLIPRRNIDDLHTDRYYYKKLKSTDALFVKIIFYSQNLNLWWKIQKEMLSMVVLGFYYSQMMVSVFSCAQR